MYYMQIRHFMFAKQFGQETCLMVEAKIIYIHMLELLSDITEQTIDAHNNLDESPLNYVERKHSIPKG